MTTHTPAMLAFEQFAAAPDSIYLLPTLKRLPSEELPWALYEVFDSDAQQLTLVAVIDDPALHDWALASTRRIVKVINRRATDGLTRGLAVWCAEAVDAPPG